MAGRKPVTSRSEHIKSHRSQKKSSKLKQKKLLHQSPFRQSFTFPVLFRSGTIFSQKYQSLALISQLAQAILFYFTATTLEFFHAVGSATLTSIRKTYRASRWLWKHRATLWARCKLAGQTLLRHGVTQSNRLVRVVSAPLRRSRTLILRWQRRGAWAFERTLAKQIASTPSDSPSTPTQAAAQKPSPENSQPSVAPVVWPRALRTHLLLRMLWSPIRPFYYTARLFPVHSISAVVIASTLMYTMIWTHTFLFVDLPDPQQLTDERPALTTTITDRNGTVLFKLYESENRTIVPLEEISPSLVYATIAIEDKDFFSHYGFSPRGITRALWSNYQNESVQGGSTITQQLVKNRLLSSERTLQRKARELILAVMVEQMYEKTEILEMYFNQVPYGGATYGAEAAAQTFFGKSASDLTLPESAMLAGLPAAPSVFSPFGPNPELAKMRQEQVLRRMSEDGYITQEMADKALAADIALQQNSISIEAPHFVMYIKQLLAERFGEERLLTEGFEVKTTLDLSLQNQTQQLVTEEVDSLARLRVTNGAALVTNPNTGEILAMVGSTDYFDFEHDGQVNVTLRPRQPGSSIKPLTYALALERGMSPNSTILDQPITFDIAGSKPYSPRNYDGKYRGNVTLKEALASSYNIPAVKLLNQIGVNTMIDKAEAIGISTWGDRARFGLSLTLGGGEVLMTDMAKMYGAFATQGYVVDLNPILEIRSFDGQLIYENSCATTGMNCSRKRVFDSRVAYQITNMLSDNAARSPAFGTQSTLFIPGQEVAVKTGTTNNLRDNWTFGYTSDRVVATWVGNNNNQPMSYVASGITGASPIWNKVMRLTLNSDQPHHFAQPEGLIKVAICATTGTLPCSGCPRVVEEYFIPGSEPKTACNLAVPVQPSVSTPPVQ